MAIPQTTYNQYPAEALQGQLVRGEDVTSHPATEVVPPGVMVQISATGSVRPCQDAAATIAGLWGISILKTTLNNAQPIGSTTGYGTGDMVPVCRRGRIWAAFQAAATGSAGTTGSTGFAGVNVFHPSVPTTSATALGVRGFLSGTATTGTAGVESTFVNGVQIVRFATGWALALVDVNLPQ